VAEVRSDQDKLSVSPGYFAEQLDEIARHFRPSSLTSLVAGIRNRPLVHGSVVVTFDDGYADNFVEARPLLERHDVPAALFVVSGYVGSGRRFWWDELEEIVFGAHVLPTSLELLAGSGEEPRHLPSGTERRALYRRFREQLGSLEERDRDELLDRLRGDVPRDRVDAGETLSVEQLRTLAEGGLIEIGAHTVSHPRLPALPPSRQLEEIRESARQLEAMIGRPVRLFSYPFGEHDRASVRSAKAAQVACACTTRAGSVRASTDCYRLPRLTVGNWPADELVARVSTLLS
jgi:peptidoglycan/xylan/chitin deacetylase (PgdA/CDA1 family)